MEKECTKNEKCEITFKMGLTGPHDTLHFLYLPFSFRSFDLALRSIYTFVIKHVLKLLLKSLCIGFPRTKFLLFPEHVAKLRFVLLTSENHKDGGDATGPFTGSLSRRKELLLSLSTGALLLPLTTIFLYFFARQFLCCAPID